MQLPPSRPSLPNPLPMLLAALLLAALFFLAQLGIITVAFEALGLSPGAALVLVACSLLGSAIDIPLVRVRTVRLPADPVPWLYRGMLRVPATWHDDHTTIAVNLGGCIVPLGFAIHLVAGTPLGLVTLALGTAGVAGVSFAASRAIAGVGIVMPVLLPPLTSALLALLLDPAHAPALAYASGTFGVLLGADVLKLRHVASLGAAHGSVGGAGTFDGIFLTGVLAVLLA